MVIDVAQYSSIKDLRYNYLITRMYLKSNKRFPSDRTTFVSIQYFIGVFVINKMPAGYGV